ncbi:hypothetical protein E3P96_02497 [Wallemia ichthyophaga]|uniref:Trafficking protein particle complex subunit n=1 Tax=Wallemia ichthyophaga TaxID=245174 RepID=A0A4T0GH85_WALIC|nr:hypothetical protein E3P96_02497 [Wallemia ichthyophaga]TIB33409.1 hypothetical protein E3P86_02989 [Wallemia ichthyophaga]
MEGLKSQEVALGSWALLFGEIINYNLNRVDGIGELESKLNWLGYRVGQRQLELMRWRAEGASRNPKQPTTLIEVLQMVHTPIWKSLFNKPADSLERSKENSNEFMITDNTPLLSRSVCIPSDLKNLSTESFTAGIVESVLDGFNYKATVSAHSVPTSQHPQRTTILIKLN